MTIEELQTKRAEIVGEYDALMLKHQRNGQRLDALANEISKLDVEIIVAKYRQKRPMTKIAERPLIKMQIL